MILLPLLALGWALVLTKEWQLFPLCGHAVVYLWLWNRNHKGWHTGVPMIRWRMK